MQTSLLFFLPVKDRDLLQPSVKVKRLRALQLQALMIEFAVADNELLAAEERAVLKALA